MSRQFRQQQRSKCAGLCAALGTAILAWTVPVHSQDILGELGASLGAGVLQRHPLVGGEARAGTYLQLRGAGAVLLGNRVGFEVRSHTYYALSAEGVEAGHVLVGVAPEASYQSGGANRYSKGVRLPSLVGAITPEVGLWLQSADKAKVYLSWRAPLVWMPAGEAGLELTPSLFWAPGGVIFATLSCGGFLR